MISLQGFSNANIMPPNNKPSHSSDYSTNETSNDEHCGPKTNTRRLTYKPIAEPIESILKKLFQYCTNTLPKVKHYELGPFKPNFWNDNEFCE